MNLVNEDLEKNVLRMISDALQQFLGEGDVLLNIEFSDEGKVKKIIVEKGERDTGLNVIKLKDTQSSDNTEKELERKITTFMHQIGIPANLSGYTYIRTVLMLCIKDPNLLPGIKVLFYKVAEQYNVSKNAVDNSIRHAIQVAWNRGNTELQERIFGYTISEKRGTPTNLEFITAAFDYLKHM